ncbi:MAG: hypothetical protein COV07_03210 [Candidatus Vogelbacteria bacterium CG10_big_fil_rev_8_21_14_0_10_45_14]|uniref:Bacterial spore germination immunoglobulin-like domain-containing protein n=1 Tax=Candidatus Vogelbacteria bacterium CG10_big_fil_rev_8_21_14_0_10_45_14 TaxID=1975042 RepID=A0A2H0RJN1_9BACT|nr:MAG: hypothetical protein COV07_03210 [Candidatus Vogelbacteria bacterium CG10_big_fil_rev_8_21_14_0_10_45_14]
MKFLPKTVRGYILLSFLILIIVYVLFVARNYLRGTSLSIDFPEDGATIEEPYLLVRGRALRAISVSVGGAKVSPKENGEWSYALLIPAGYSIIDVVSEDRFGRTKTITREVFYEKTNYSQG